MQEQVRDNHETLMRLVILPTAPSLTAPDACHREIAIPERPPSGRPGSLELWNYVLVLDLDGGDQWWSLP